MGKWDLGNFIGTVWSEESHSGVPCLSKVRQNCHHAGVKTHVPNLSGNWKVLVTSKEYVEWDLALACPFSSWLFKEGKGYRVPSEENQYHCQKLSAAASLSWSLFGKKGVTVQVIYLSNVVMSQGLILKGKMSRWIAFEFVYMILSSWNVCLKNLITTAGESW